MSNAPATTARGEIVPRNQAIANIQATLDNERFLARVADTAVKGLDARHVANVALNVIRTNDALQRCDPMSIAGALCQAASTGLLPGNGLGHAYLIPRGGECQYQIGYQGWRELAMRSGHVRSIVSRCVYEGDEFAFSWGTEDDILHRPGKGHGGDPKAVTHVYAVAHMRDAPPVIEVMARAEVERIREKARARSGPWVTDWAEMARKTVIIRLCKSLPRTAEMARAIETQPEMGDPEDIVEGQVEVIDQETGEVTRGSASKPKAEPDNSPPDACFDCQKALGPRAQRFPVDEAEGQVVCLACQRKREKAGDAPANEPGPGDQVADAVHAQRTEEQQATLGDDFGF